MTEDLSPVTAPTAPVSQRTEVRHNTATLRYTLWLDGEPVGLADYILTPTTVRFTHTEIDPRHRRQGLASILIEHALTDVCTHTSLRVIPQCPYVARWIDEHAEYQDLLIRGL
ncbi:GNAT family N-acetyltransferase [Cryobacterium sp. CG_9.6]|uniref:GNAT family N-acetyltransferase n=1 Tax=Cryobacterium sp. CG_9.6 TaxID=2760710 RepID=UPI0024739AC5|nr:GNAT family N-acetyltransferase [Cryobacterium sp. CG_9.6]MDH6235577.1 putative GNAT family acetyltransferase [Cryobacterium sp. CG_9.6]